MCLQEATIQQQRGHSLTPPGILYFPPPPPLVAAWQANKLGRLPTMVSCMSLPAQGHAQRLTLEVLGTTSQQLLFQPVNTLIKTRHWKLSLHFWTPATDPPPPSGRENKALNLHCSSIHLFLKQLVPAGRPVKEFTRATPASHERKHISVLYLGLGHSHQRQPPFVVNITCRSLLRLDPLRLSFSPRVSPSPLQLCLPRMVYCCTCCSGNSQVNESACPSSRFQALDFHKPSEEIKSIRL